MVFFENVSFCYDKVKTNYSRNVLENISFQIQEGEKIGLAGANGVGKSTLLKLLVGLLDRYEGRITVDGIPVEPSRYPQIRERAAPSEFLPILKAWEPVPPPETDWNP